MTKIFFDDCFEDEKQFINNAISSFKNINGETVILRHWMMSKTEYASIEHKVTSMGGNLYSTTEQYEMAHKMPQWYPHFESVTFNTSFIDNDDEAIKEWYDSKEFSSVFVKDHIKSLTTSTGSVAHTPEQFYKIIEEMRYYGIDGGFSFREYRQLKTQTENRHFFINGQIIGDLNIDDHILTLVKSFPCKFFSFDTILDENNKQWLVEVGDGQVSSTKLPESETRKLYQLMDCA